MSVIELSLAGRGPGRAWVFDHHRFALPCWAEVGPALLITLDRHFDTVPPQNPPPRELRGDELLRWTTEKLDHRNYDHIPAAQHCGVITDAIIVARAKPVGARTDFCSAHTLDLISAEWGTPHASPEGKRAHQLVRAAERIVLDVDLDCFTTPSDADPTTVIPWTRELISDFVMPRGSSDFWNDVLAKCVGFTFAREPNHCGGLIAGGRLFETASQVLFVDLLKSDLP
ncbi:MAG: UPF0489 family protein [Archangium sp.]|nr:UPF0489 family protein [Archangium sp.]